MKKISNKRAAQERILKKYRDEELPRFCEICGRPASDLAHLLPRSLYGEYYTEKWNCHALCRDCHNKFDADPEFRKQQTKLYNEVKQHDEKAARHHFRIFD